MLDRKWSVVVRDLILPTLAILLTAYNVVSLHTQRKDSYNDILFTQQMEATGEIAERLSIYQGELIALLQLKPETPNEQVMQQTNRAIDAGRLFSKVFTKWAPIMPDGLLLEMTRYHAVASRTQEPFVSHNFPRNNAEMPQQMQKELMRSYAKVFQRMRAELGVDTLNGESKLLLEKLQTGRADPNS
jgi:hypothetical protein